MAGRYADKIAKEKELAAGYSKKLERLRTDLAICRGRSILENFISGEMQPDGHPLNFQRNSNDLKNYLVGLFLQIHTEMFQDWNDHAFNYDSIKIQEKPVFLKRQNATPPSYTPQQVQEAIGGAYPPGVRKDNQEAYEKAIHDLVGGIFAQDGNVSGTENGDKNKKKELCANLAKFYHTMREIAPFEYGNQLTLNLFMVALSNLQTFRTAYGTINFKRLNINIQREEDLKDAKALTNPESSEAELAVAFEHALDASHDVDTGLHIKAEENGGEKERGIIKILGLEFLSHTTRSDVEYTDWIGTPVTIAAGTRCLVTLSGGLVPLSKIPIKEKEKNSIHTLEEAQQRSYKGYQGQWREIDYTDLSEIVSRVSDNNVIGYLPKTKMLRRWIGKEEEELGGNMTDDMQLACLDENQATGFLPEAQKPLDQYLKRLAPHTEGLLYDIANADKQAGLESSLWQGFDLSPRKIAIPSENMWMIELIRKAAGRLKTLKKELEIVTDSILTAGQNTGKEDAKAILCIGASGSGKTSRLKGIAETLCGERHTYIAYDDLRGKGRFWQLLNAVELANAEPNRDDYSQTKIVTDWLRNMVLEKLSSHKTDIIYDMTNYTPGLVNQLPPTYKTQVLAIDAPIETAFGRKREGEKQGKPTINYQTAVRKHVESVRSFLSAVQDGRIEKATLFDNSGEAPHLIAETFDYNDPTEVGPKFILSENNITLHRGSNLKTLRGMTLDHLFQSQWKTHPFSIRESTIPENLADLIAEPSAPASKSPHLKGNDSSDNLSYLLYNLGNKLRVLAIYDLDRFITFVQKAQLNELANSMEHIRHRPDALAWVVRDQIGMPIAGIQATRNQTSPSVSSR